MIVKRVVALAAAIAALVAAVGCAVVALCFAIYALLRDVITPAGASAAIVLLCAVIAGVGAMVMFSQFKAPPPRPQPAPTPEGLLERVVDAARDHPLMAAGAAVAAGAAAFLNPAIVTAVLRAFTEQRRNRR